MNIMVKEIYIIREMYPLVREVLESQVTLKLLILLFFNNS